MQNFQTMYLHFNLLNLVLIFVSGALFNGQIYAEDKVKKSRQPIQESRQIPQESRQAKYSDYSHELIMNFDYQLTNGELSSKSTADKVETQDLLAYSARISYGYLVSDYVEPFIEGEYKIATETISKFEVKKNQLRYGVGVLFNIPLLIKKMSLTTLENSHGNLKFSNATFIPYGGLIFTVTDRSEEQTDKSNDSSSTGDSDNTKVTKLVAGFRFKLYSHIALNTSMRMLYQESNIEATGDKGGKTKKFTVEGSLLALTLLF